ncbi:MAG: acylneuraminate cytidylyltransferase [Spirochaetae bacterium HGW-Spirochaetae-5]|jgi:N-acylneuraminate cytidylyltransferase|nr:MAG: acylneuraminate cytidylyltransferase [Spirochaetae bacterium HGW-Spirochaetae-5]
MTIWKALIPIRSGSKSIPDKNIKLFCDKPLFYWATQAAVDSGIFNGGVYVASDSEHYLDLVKEWTPQAIPLQRAPYTATDDASSESVMSWFLNNHSCDVISLVQATTPTVTSSDFLNAKILFENESADSLVTAVPFHRFLWSASGNALNYDPRNRPRRQDMQPQFLENGSFYFTNTVLFKEQQCRLGGKISVYEMSEDTMIEIDEPIDWKNAERVFLKRKSVVNSAKRPSVIIVDVDGTLTDGGMYYDKDGELIKKFNTRDGSALAQLKEMGLTILVCTGENSPAVNARLKKLEINEYLHGITDKVEAINEWLDNNDFSWNDVLYVGDEYNDFSAIQRAAFSVCPSDSHPSVKNIASYIAPSKGGDGVIRDVLFWVKRNFS